MRSFLLDVKLIDHSGRQNFYLGKLKSGKNKADLLAHLHQLGFSKDPYAWIDEGEAESLRKIDEDLYQYHLRLYAGGEIRGHYEYALDRRPLKHFFGVHQRAKEGEFEKMLAGFLE